MRKIASRAFIDAILTFLYIVLVASFIYFLGSSFPDSERSIIIPIAMLMLLVFSVALVGSLLFGRPVMLYIDGKKKEAISLLGYTLVIFFVITLFVFLLLLSAL